MSLNSTHSDEMLLSLMREDDQEAFTIIYRRYWEGLFITAVKALRGKHEAEDVVQDVLLSLWNRRKDLQIESSLAAYLQTSIRYKAIHYIERNIRRNDYLALLTELAVSIPAPSADIQLQMKELQQTIHEVIAKMPPKMQEVYRLSRNEHLTHREIAEKLEISVETVKKHIQHALQLIKSALGCNAAAVSILLLYLLF